MMPAAVLVVALILALVGAGYVIWVKFATYEKMQLEILSTLVKYNVELEKLKNAHTRGTSHFHGSSGESA